MRKNRRYQYTATPGSPAHKALSYFAESPSQEMSSADLAQILGIETATVRATLNKAIEAGAIAMRRVGQIGYYSLGTQAPLKTQAEYNAEVAALKFTVALGSDGELRIAGARTIDGVVTLELRQSAELREYLLHTGSLIERLQSQGDLS